MNRIRVQLRDTATGETAVHVEDDAGELGTLGYMWCEGNYRCDCNRKLFFYRAGQPDYFPPNAELPCGETRYAVDWFEFNGERVHWRGLNP